MPSTNPLTAHTGSQITGLDASKPVDHADSALLLHELDTRGVIVLRGQHLTPETFLAFCRQLGEPAVHPLHQYAHHAFPEIMLHTNIVENGKPLGYADTGQKWRMDGAHLKTPHRATLLYAVEIPECDGVPLGDTCFANTAAAWEALPANERSALQNMIASHPYRPGQKRRTIPFFMDSGLSQAFRRGTEHPVARAHPVTGRQCLYVSEATTSFIRGMHDHDSDALLATLRQHIVRDKFIYRHTWQSGDLVLWDNCLIQHRTDCNYALPMRRLLYQAQIKGDAHARRKRPARSSTTFRP